MEEEEDNLAASLGQLSTSAREWVPGQGFSPTKHSSTNSNTGAGAGSSPQIRPLVSDSAGTSGTSPRYDSNNPSAWNAGMATAATTATWPRGTSTSSAVTSTSTSSRTTATGGAGNETGKLKWNPNKEFVPNSTSTWSATTRQQQTKLHQLSQAAVNTNTSTMNTSTVDTNSSSHRSKNPWSSPQSATIPAGTIQSTMDGAPQTYPQEDKEEDPTNASATNSLQSTIPNTLHPPPQTKTYTSNNPTHSILATNQNHSQLPPTNTPRTVYQSFGLPPNGTLWTLYRNQSIDNSRQMKPNDERYKAIPLSFYKAMPLEQSDTVVVPSISNISSSSGLNGLSSSSTMGNASTIHSTTTAAISSAHSSTLNPQPQHIYNNRSSFGYPSSIFKVTSKEDGNLYCLRRFDNVKCVNPKIANVVNRTWNNAMVPSSYTTQQSPSSPQSSPNTNGKYVMDHPGIVRMYKCFHISQNHRAVFFLHHYYPNALTLREVVHGLGSNINPPNTIRGGGVTEAMMSEGFQPLPEETIWSFATQLVSAIRVVHRANLACRTLQLNHILVTPDVGSGSVAMPGQNDDGGEDSSSSSSLYLTNRVRLRINCIGIVDALEFEARKQIADLQKEDIRALGRILLSLASGTEIGSEDVISQDSKMARCDLFVRQHYSPQLHNLAMTLIAKSHRPPSSGGNSSRMDFMMMPPLDPPSIGEVCRAVTDRVFDEMDSAHAVVDGMEETLSSEFESGRGLRLLLKLGFVNERPEFGVDRRWSETGDCYVLKLFRDYVFHQADATGRPVMDLGHIVTSLNKLDAADPEKIVLASRDGKSIMVVSYADVSRCLENAYAELCANSVTPQILLSETRYSG